MLYANGPCPMCEQGNVGFRVCSDGKTVVLLCDECEALWRDPGTISPSTAEYPAAPDYRVPGQTCSVAGPEARWATRAEVDRAGWGGDIAGEGAALGDS